MATIKEITDALSIHLQQLQAMTPLEPSDKALSDEDHEAWMKRHAQIQRVLASATAEAEKALPAEIRHLLWKVRKAGHALYSPRETNDVNSERGD